MTNAEAIALAIEALRADAESAEGSGPLADPASAARDRAAARALEALAEAIRDDWTMPDR